MDHENWVVDESEKKDDLNVNCYYLTTIGIINNLNTFDNYD